MGCVKTQKWYFSSALNGTRKITLLGWLAGWLVHRACSVHPRLLDLPCCLLAVLAAVKRK